MVQHTLGRRDIYTELQGSRIDDAASTVCAEAHLGDHRGGGARMGYLQEHEYEEASDSEFFTQQSLRIPLPSPLGCRIRGHPMAAHA